ncbi:MAG TPA: hypothetical protein VNO26_04165 [Candidatus Limnocylindria bacterium]|nr:hypothetical protein [Candidatus Limnocylindria bacterium]
MESPRRPTRWSGIAYNQATASDNRIHSDEVARRYGFRGGLVPGVTVYAYLVQPAVEAWGLDFLAHGAATIRLDRPLYDRGAFTVDVHPEGDAAYRGEVRDHAETVCGSGRVSLAAEATAPPVRRGDPPAPRAEARPEASREALERLRETGMGALELEWRASGELDRTSRELDVMPDLIRPDRGGWANPAFTLGCANWVLAANVRLGPWIHVQSEVRHFAAVPRDARLVVEARIADLFARGGHEFVDLDVALFLRPDRPALAARHRAIYRLRDPA